MWPFASSSFALTAEQLAQENLTFDYIVIGGGSAGSCLASRLSEDRSISVLLVERGIVGDNWTSSVPLISANIYRSGSPSAIFPILPLKHANNRVVHAVIGEGLGGGSRINSSVVTRGVGDYNLWRDMGHPSWGYLQLEPYFAKSENTLSQPASKFRGKSGPVINQTFPDAPFECVNRVLQATKSIGIPTVSDVNSPEAPATCCTSLDIATDASMHRVSTMSAFLPAELVSRRPNLTICAETIVTRIRFDAVGHTLRAVGVDYEATRLTRTSRSFFVKANREVILCAGAIASPQLLMLSGVGPKENLSEFGIRVLKDMPGVGSYLKDHASIPVMYQVPMDDSLHILRKKPFRAMTELLHYLISGGGMFGRAFLNWSIFVQSSLFNASMEFVPGNASNLDVTQPHNTPDVEIMPIPHRCTEEEHSELDNLGVFSFLTCLVKPKSHGTVRLASADPHARAAIDLSFLENSEDIIVFRRAVRLALKLAAQVKSQGYPCKPLLVPHSESDADLDVFIRENIRTSYHYTSTCRMAPETDSIPGVVDDDLKVHGVSGLRICDASIFPEIPSTHTMAPAIVVAEKCADIIKATWKT